MLKTTPRLILAATVDVAEQIHEPLLARTSRSWHAVANAFLDTVKIDKLNIHFAAVFDKPIIHAQLDAGSRFGSIRCAAIPFGDIPIVPIFDSGSLKLVFSSGETDWTRTLRPRTGCSCISPTRAFEAIYCTLHQPSIMPVHGNSHLIFTGLSGST